MFGNKKVKPETTVPSIRIAQKPKRERSIKSPLVSALNMNSVVVKQSADRENFYDRDISRAAAREAAKNNEYITKYLASLQNGVIGPKGIQLDANFKSARNKNNDLVNNSIKTAFKDWSKFGKCSVDGRMSFVDFQRLVIRTLAVDGEVLIQHCVRSDTRYGYKIKLIDVDRLMPTGETRVTNQLNGNIIRDGVEIDEDGATVAYHVYQNHPSYGTGQARRIPAEQMIHLFRQTRPEQTRGLTWLKPVLGTLGHIDKFTESTMTAMDFAARKMLAFLSKNKESDAIADAQANRNREIEDEQKGITQVRFDGEPVETQVMNGSATLEDCEAEYGNSLMELDEKRKAFTVSSDFDIKAMEWNQPNIGVVDFTKAQLRRVSSGLLGQYNDIGNDLESINLSSIRHGIIPERDNYKSLQAYLVEALLQPIYERWLECAVFAPKGLKLTKIQNSYDYYQDVKWIPRGFPMVDINKETDSNIKLVQAGFRSQRAIIAEAGDDIEDTFTEIADDNELASSLNIVRVFDNRPPVIDNTTDEEPMPIPVKASS